MNRTPNTIEDVLAGLQAALDEANTTLANDESGTRVRKAAIKKLESQVAKVTKDIERINNS